MINLKASKGAFQLTVHPTSYPVPSDLPKRKQWWKNGQRYVLKINRDEYSWAGYVIWDVKNKEALDHYGSRSDDIEAAFRQLDRLNESDIATTRKASIRIVHCIITPEEKLKIQMEKWTKAANELKQNSLKNHAKNNRNIKR